MADDHAPTGDDPAGIRAVAAANGDIEVTCACGWEARGPADDAVRQTQEHGRKLHNMEATRDDVLRMARPVTA